MARYGKTRQGGALICGGGGGFLETLYFQARLARSLVYSLTRKQASLGLGWAASVVMKRARTRIVEWSGVESARITEACLFFLEGGRTSGMNECIWMYDIFFDIITPLPSTVACMYVVG